MWRASVQRKKKSKKGTSAEQAGTKRPQADAPEVVAGRKKVKRGVLESLFHDDGEGTQIKETYLCRSVGGRGTHLA
jgi:hypothetical protein